MLEEVWKDIPGYDDNYMASNFGSIKSKKRDVYYSNRINPNHRKEALLKPRLGKRGYLTVNLLSNKKTKVCTVHRLVAAAFLDTFSKTLYVDHITGNKLDNGVTNLRIVSFRQNMLNRIKAENKISKYKGVSMCSNVKSYRAYAVSDNTHKYVHLGNFIIEKDAALAYDNYAREHYGEYGRYNFPQEGERGIN